MSSETAGTKGLAGRYASALYDLASERNMLDQVAGDIRSLQTAMKESADFRRFVSSPILSREDLKKGIAALSASLGLSDLTTSFLGLIAQNRRLFALGQMADAYLAMLAAARGEVTAEVISAKFLSDAQIADLAASLKQSVGKDVSMNIFIDPAILGGLIVKVGSRMVDNSVRTKLQRLQLAMKGVG